MDKNTHFYGINMLDIYFKVRGGFHLTDNKVNNSLRKVGLPHVPTTQSKRLKAGRKRSGPNTSEMMLFFLALHSTIKFCHLFVNIK